MVFTFCLLLYDFCFKSYRSINLFSPILDPLTLRRIKKSLMFLKIEDTQLSSQITAGSTHSSQDTGSPDICNARAADSCKDAGSPDTVQCKIRWYFFGYRIRRQFPSQDPLILLKQDPHSRCRESPAGTSQETGSPDTMQDAMTLRRIQDTQLRFTNYRM